MARIDDYKESFRLASVELSKRDVARLAESAGVELTPEQELVVPFLGARYKLEIHPHTEIRKVDSNEEVSLQDKILIAHYLLGATGTKPAQRLITFRQIPDGHFYFEAFQRRARDPFVNFFGNNGPFFVKCAEMMGGVPVENGDYGMEFAVFPHIRIQLVLWLGDGEFPPDAAILFDETVQRLLPVEDIAVMSGSLVYRLIALGRKVQSGA